MSAGAPSQCSYSVAPLGHRPTRLGAGLCPFMKMILIIVLTSLRGAQMSGRELPLIPLAQFYSLGHGGKVFREKNCLRNCRFYKVIESPSRMALQQLLSRVVILQWTEGGAVPLPPTPPPSPLHCSPPKGLSPPVQSPFPVSWAAAASETALRCGSPAGMFAGLVILPCNAPET